MSKNVTVSKEVEFDAGHRVPNHKSKCRSPHGHRYRVVVYCTGSIVEEVGAPDEGMLIDFGDLKELMVNIIHDYLDHSFIVWEHDKAMNDALWAGDRSWKVIQFPYIPTAENIAIWCYDQLEEVIADHWRGNLKLDSVAVYETPTSLAVYKGVL